MTPEQIREFAVKYAAMCEEMADQVRDLRKDATAIDEWDAVELLRESEQSIRWAGRDLKRVLKEPVA